MESARQVQEEPRPEAVEFVRFCYRRRRTGWPEIYDEMCAVAGRGLYRGWTHADLAEHGIAFSLFGMSALAALVRRVIAEDEALRRSGPQVAIGRRDVAPAPVTASPVEESGATPIQGVAAAVA